MTLEPRPDFDWGRVSWGRPDSPPRPFCAYCHVQISEGDVPLMIWKEDGSGARFCDRCMVDWWGFDARGREANV